MTATSTLARIRAEHDNEMRLLALLERQVKAMGDGGFVDWEVVRLTVSYLLYYPDFGHNRLEALLLSRLRRIDPDAAAAFTPLLDDHRELADRLRRIASAVSHAPHETAPTRNWVAARLAGFVRQQGDHSAREENLFLPAVARVFNRADWAEVDRMAGIVADPLFGPRPERRFLPLRRHIPR